MNKLDNILSSFIVASSTTILAFFDSTITFLIALIAGFCINIIAGFRADEVKVTLHRLFPPIVLFKNFNGNKFKDSLLELALIAGVSYFIKGLIVLFKYNEFSDYVVQWLFIIAVYFYVRNSLRNLSTAYSRIKWITMLYAVIGFKFREIVGANVADIVDSVEKKDAENEGDKRS